MPYRDKAKQKKAQRESYVRNKTKIQQRSNKWKRENRGRLLELKHQKMDREMDRHTERHERPLMAKVWAEIKNED